jgi:hypothetical protein
MRLFFQLGKVHALTTIVIHHARVLSDYQGLHRID